jgi:hypothetical protein
MRHPPLHLGPCGSRQSSCDRGQAGPYHPSVPLKLYIYGYLNRVLSIAQVLEGPVSSIFEGASLPTGNSRKLQNLAEMPALITEFFATSEGLAMSRAMVKIKDKELRRRLVALAEQIAGTVGTTQFHTIVSEVSTHPRAGS